jgi:energy-coupling factor transporter ATP-binding protein EcfA2
MTSVVAEPIEISTEPKSPFASDDNLLECFGRDVAEAGLVGETLKAQLVFLVASSARLAEPLHVTITGSSSAGKSHLMNTVARFIPDEHKKILTGMSAKALLHAGEFEFKHKAVFIAEYEGVAGSDYPIRTFQSEKGIVYEYVECTPKGIEKKSKLVQGPAAFIQTTTRSRLHPENETRLLFVTIDESPQQTEAILMWQAQKAAGLVPPPDGAIYRPWHEYLRSLSACEVVIPYADALVPYFPRDKVISRRDLPKLLGLIKVSAYLHQHRRNRDAEGRIVATLEDYQMVRPLFLEAYRACPDQHVLELLGAVSGLKEFTPAQVVERTRWGKTKAYEVLEKAQELGVVAKTDRRGHYRVVNAQGLPPDLNLPTKLRLPAEIMKRYL